MLRIAFYSRDQTADAADDKIYLYACHGRFDQLLDQFFVGQGIDLHPNIGFLSLFRLLDFFPDHVDQLILQAFRCHEQIFRLIHCLGETELLEHFRCFLADLLVCCHKGEVCIQLRGLLIIISGSDLCDITHFAIRQIGDLTELGMYLDMVDSINHATTRIL